MSGIHRRHWSNILRVEEDFQKRQILRILACTAGYVVVSTALLCVFYVYLMDPSLEGASFWTAVRELLSSPDGREALGGLVLAWVVSMSGLSALFAAYTGFSYSHHIAGPLYGLKRDLERIGDDGAGFQPIHLRSGDELGDLVAVLNRAFVAVRNASPGAGDVGDLRTELRKQLAEIKSDELCEADAARVEAWIDGLRRAVD